MNKFKNVNLIKYLFGIFILIFIFFFLITATQIGYGVKERCQLAQEKYGGDCVEALINLLDDSGNSFRDRNSAIWALGQLGDQRALSTLEKYHSGDIPAKEPLDQVISQYELQKAIKLVKGGFNITAFFWRFDMGLK